MNITRHLLIGLTVATLGVSGAAQAHGGDDDRGDMQRDGSRFEQRTERRGDLGRQQERVVRRDRDDDRDSARSTKGHREHDRLAYHDHRHEWRHGHRYGSASWVDRRQDRQRHRIREGWRSGELTRGEAKRLYRQHRSIAKMERRYTADGYLSAKEQRRLDRALDRASRQIRRAKHNDRVAYRRHEHHHDHQHRW